MGKSYKNYPHCNWVGITAEVKRTAKRESNRMIRHMPVDADVPSGSAYRRIARWKIRGAAFYKDYNPWEREIEWWVGAGCDPDDEPCRRVWERLYYAK